MEKVIIFGVQDFAQLASFYLRHDSDYEVVAFTVNRDHMPSAPTFDGKPVVPFEGIENSFKPGDYKMFAPLSRPTAR